MPDNGLPLVSAAFLCEKVITDKLDDVLSLIRVVDQFTVGAPPDVVERLNPQLALTLVVMLKANGQSGQHNVGVRLHGPTKSHEVQTIAIAFPDGNNRELAGVNLIVQIAVGVVKNTGEFRIELTYDGRYLTKVPFRVQPLPAQPIGAAVGPRP